MAGACVAQASAVLRAIWIDRAAKTSAEIMVLAMFKTSCAIAEMVTLEGLARLTLGCSFAQQARTAVLATVTEIAWTAFAAVGQVMMATRVTSVLRCQELC